MPRRIRIQKKHAIYHVCNRTLQQRFFFRPSEEVNRIILACLARAATKHKIRLFGFVFMSNHFHMLLQAYFMNLSEFMRDFQSAVARRLNELHGREGKFFARRYSSEHVLDDEAFLDKLEYTLNNPCMSNLVRHIDRWPGISSWSMHKTGEPMVGQYLDRAKLRELRRKDPSTPKEAAFVEYPLEVAAPPMWAGLPDEEQRQKVCQMVEAGAWKLQKQRRLRRIDCLGPRAILAQHWSTRPKKTKRSPRPLCHSSCPRKRKEHEDEMRQITDWYKEAMAHMRKGRANPPFPDGTIPPGRTRCVGAPPTPEELARLRL